MKCGVSGCAATTVLLFVSAGCEIAAAAETSETSEPRERGFYLGASVSQVEHEAQGEGQILVGFGFPVNAIFTLLPNQVVTDDTDTGWNLTLGYQINKYVAAEVAYYDFGTASVVERYSTDFLPVFLGSPINITVRSNIESFGPGVSVLGTFPLTPSLEIFARGGMLFLDQKIERQTNSFRDSRRTGEEIWMAGAGVRWSFASRWATRLEYQLTDDIEVGGSSLAPQSGTSKIEQLSLSVLFDF